MTERKGSAVNRRRLGQFLIGGVFSACAVLITALIDLVRKEDAKKPETAETKPESP